ncbi:9411_t:CDS:2 [Paraglomus brasilianum]|uniref:DNA polymerase delta subunit 3 n=1 Tax=Paraglomus brasilianum TaxID=144538 RepID=A0A9N8ZJ02_9GLOM|nr:9411_t:CDS:2 [Paraglomus brasilianum]
MTEQLNILNTLINDEKRLITYKWISRHFGIHVNLAKQLLSEFKSLCDNTGKCVHITYCVCGILTDEQRIVTLVSQEDLENVKMKFAKLTSVHVYSVGYNKPKDSLELAVVDHAIQEETSEPRNFNVIRNRNAIVADVPRPAIIPPRKPEFLMKVMTKEPNPTVEISNNVPASKPNPTVEISNNVPASKPNPTVEISNNVPASKPNPTVEISNNVPVSKPNPTVEISNNVPASKPQPMEKKLMKNRKTGTKVYKDARGFLVTEDVVEWEACSEDKTVVRDVTSSKMNRACNLSENNASGPKSTKRKHNGSMGQKTLLSFFGKTGLKAGGTPGFLGKILVWISKNPYWGGHEFASADLKFYKEMCTISFHECDAYTDTNPTNPEAHNYAVKQEICEQLVYSGYQNFW